MNIPITMMHDSGTGATRQVILTELGFYARCSCCQWASTLEHARFRAQMAAEAHECEATS